MREYRVRSMGDIGVGIPVMMTVEPDPALLEDVLRYAGIIRGEGLRLARREIAKDRNSTLRIILTLLKVMVIPHTEEMLGTDDVRQLKTECRSGCNACCYQNVEVSIPEAILVSLQLADPADPRRQSLLDTADAVAGLSNDARVRGGLPCPLLVDGKCSVYENRPLLCRATLSPCAQRCYDSLQGGGSPEIYLVPQFFSLGDKDALRGICKDLSLQYDNVDLVQAVAAILRDPSMVVRWASGEHLFVPLAKTPEFSLEPAQ